MKLKHDKQKKTISETENIEGLFECSFEHKIEKSSASLVWRGPKIPHEVWQQVLSFFKWTYDTTKSESQVRLFVNVADQTWAAWAFPQESRTGMSAREIVNEDSKKQREQFDANWLYFGTVHHHCNMSAFQSSTDRSNEEGQDGLHITIGNMEASVHDMHCRFYRKGLCFEPDMSWFWDVGDVVATCPEQFRNYLPKNIEDKTARAQMCQPSSVEFPVAWRENLIELKKPGAISPSMFPDYHSTTSSDVPATYSSEMAPLWQRSKRAWDEIIFEIKKQNVEVSELEDALGDILLGAHEILLKACLHHKVDGDDLERDVPRITNALLELEAQENLVAEAKEQLESELSDNPPQPTAGGDKPNAWQEDPNWRDYLTQ